MSLSFANKAVYFFKVTLCEDCMKTEVVMRRFIDGCEIRQKSKTEYFSVTDMLKIINRNRVLENKTVVSFSKYMSLQSTVEFLEALSADQGVPVDVLVSSNKKSGSWAHPFVLLDIVMWSCPKLRVEIYKWIYDNLLQYRNKSGVSFKEMNIALDAAFNIGGRYWIYAQVANKIAEYCKVGFEDDRWNTATQEQLQLRDAIQNAVITVCESGFVPADSNIEKFIETIYRNEYRKLLKLKKIT